MRMRRNRMKEHYLRKSNVKKDRESGTYVEYGAAVAFNGEVWPASGKVQAEMYGERLSYIRNLKINGKYTVALDEKNQVHYIFESGMDVVESDGLCLYVSKDSEPDYKVISIKPYNPLRLEAEKL